MRPEIKSRAVHLDENRVRQEKWAHLTEGLKTEYDRIVLENLLDNTQNYMQSLEEATTTGSFPTFTTYAFPLIRRVFPALISNELVATQPMPMPTGLVFYLDFKYSNSLAPTVAQDRMDIQRYGMTSYSDRGKFNPYYGTGARGEVPSGAVDSSNKNFSCLNHPIRNLVVYVDAVIAPMDSYDLSAGTFVLHTAPTTGSTVTVDYDLSFEGLDNSPEIELGITQDSVAAEEKRLKARWTLEAQQDLMAYHGLDAENELITLLADEIRREVDRMIVNDLYANVGHNVNWSKTYNPAAGQPGEGYTRKEYYETLFHAIVDAGTQIFKKRYVQPNWIIAGPEDCARLEKVNGFRFMGDVAGGDIVKGVHLYGTIQNKYKLFSDPLCPANKIYVGYKGNSFFDAGYVYCPYIPLYTTPTIIDVDFKPRRAIMTRFGRKLISNDFYSSVTLTS